MEAEDEDSALLGAYVSGLERPERGRLGRTVQSPPVTKGSQGRSPEQGPQQPLWPDTTGGGRRQALPPWRRPPGRAGLPRSSCLLGPGPRPRPLPPCKACSAPHALPPCHPAVAVSLGPPERFYDSKPTTASLPGCLWVVPKASDAPPSSTPAHTSSYCFLPWLLGTPHARDLGPDHPKEDCEPERVRGSPEVTQPKQGSWDSGHSLWTSC